jgi:5-methylcytosine-specific restriction endonuclease McrA
MIKHWDVMPGWALYRMNLFSSLSIGERNRLRKQAVSIMKDANSRDALRLELYRKYGRQCVKCHSTKHLTIDHILPISKGGESVLKNLQILCRSCNEEKDTRIIDYRPS